MKIRNLSLLFARSYVFVYLANKKQTKVVEIAFKSD